MLRPIAIESTLVLTLAAGFLLLAATFGLPGPAEPPGVEAAAETAAGVPSR